MIRALPEECRWYVDDFIIKAECLDDLEDYDGCDVYEGECFNKLCSRPEKKSANSQSKISESKTPSQDDLFASVLNKMTERAFQSNEIEELEKLLLDGFNGVCVCPKPDSNSVLGKLVVAVEMFCRTSLNKKDILTVMDRRVSKNDIPSSNLQYLKERIGHHAKWLMDENADPLGVMSVKVPKFSDIIFIPHSKFDSLLDNFMTKVLDRSGKCSHAIAQDIMADWELTIVALFATRYRLVLYSAETMMFKFRLEVEEICEELLLLGVGGAVRCVIQVGKVFCADGRTKVFNRFTRQEETIDILDYPSRLISIFLSGLLKEYKEFRRIYPKGVDEKKIENYDIFCNPVYRQIILLMEMRNRHQQIGLFS